MRSSLSRFQFFLATLITTGALAGDGNPFPPQRVQIDFANPLPAGDLLKFNRASFVVQFAKPDGGRLHELADLRPASMTVAAGKQYLQVPEVIVRDLGPLNLSQTKFEWGFGQYRLSLSGTLAGERGEIVFFWSSKDGAPLRVLVNEKDRSSRYPAVFAAPTAMPPKMSVH